MIDIDYDAINYSDEAETLRLALMIYDRHRQDRFAEHDGELLRGAAKTRLVAAIQFVAKRACEAGREMKVRRMRHYTYTTPRRT